MKRFVRYAVLFALLCFSFRQAAVIREHTPSVSLRFSTPFSIDQAAPFAAAWSEEKGIVSGIATTLIRFTGDAQLAFPAAWVCGVPLNDLMENACAVSTRLAWELYGATDVTGLTVEFEGKTYHICGVFDQDSPVLLLSGEDGFTAAELFPVPAGMDPYRYAGSCAAQAGLEEPTQILCGPEAAFLAVLLPWLSVLLTAWPLARRMARGRNWVWLIVVLILLPVIPDWFVPTRWSDTVFWAELAHSLYSRFQDWLTLNPTLRDLTVKEGWFELGIGILCSWAVTKDLTQIS